MTDAQKAHLNVMVVISSNYPKTNHRIGELLAEAVKGTDQEGRLVIVETTGNIAPRLPGAGTERGWQA